MVLFLFESIQVSQRAAMNQIDFGNSERLCPSIVPSGLTCVKGRAAPARYDVIREGDIPVKVIIMANIQRYGGLFDDVFGDLTRGFWLKPVTMPGDGELKMKLDVKEDEKAYIDARRDSRA